MVIPVAVGCLVASTSTREGRREHPVEEKGQDTNPKSRCRYQSVVEVSTIYRWLKESIGPEIGFKIFRGRSVFCCPVHFPGFGPDR